MSRTDSGVESRSDRTPPASRRRSGSGGRRWADTIYVLPIVALIVALFVYPLIFGFDLSLQRSSGLGSSDYIGSENYRRAFDDPVFRRAILNTVVFTAAAIVLQTGLGFFFAVLMAEVRRFRTFYRFALFAPFVLSPVAVGAVWKYLYAPYFGPISNGSDKVGITDPGSSFLSDPRFALAAIMATFLWRYIGFNTVVYLAAFQSIPQEIYEQAELDGVSWWGRVRHITWPMVRPETITLVLLTTIGTLHVFDMMWIMTRGGPDHATETASTYIYVTAFRFFQVGYAQALAIIQVGLILVIAGLEYLAFRRMRAER